MLRLSEKVSGASVQRGLRRVASATNMRRGGSIDKALAAFNPSLPRVGRVERQVKRAFIANDFRPLTMSEIWPRVYPGIKRAKHWHRWDVRQALLKIAKPIGRSPTGRGRPGIWALTACETVGLGD